MSNEPSATAPAKRPLDDFHVVDAKTASWVARKINEARAHRQRVKAWAARELRRAERREQFFLMRFGGELERWARSELAKNGRRKAKSIDLPGGTLCFRAERPRLVIIDEAALIAWAKTNLPAAVKTVESVAKSELNRHLADTGECADGAELSICGERFLVR